MRNNYRLTIKEHAFVSNANDIALLRLKTPINFSYLVSPACLYLGRREECGKKNLIVTGWGATEESKLRFLNFVKKTVFYGLFFHL